MTPKQLRRRIIKGLTTLVMIWAGLQLIAWKMSSGGEASNAFTRTAIFGGNQFTSVASGLTDARVNVILGGIAIDLTGAQLASPGAELVIECKLAGVAVTVPPNWRVEIVDVATQGGEVHIDVTDPAELATDAPELRIRANVLFGGVAIGTN